MMKSLRILSVATMMAAFAVSLQAQTEPVVYGHTTISTSSFLQYLASFNVTVTDLSGNPVQNSSTTFPIKEGALDLQTAAVEVANAGGYIFSGNNNTVRIQDLVLDTTNPANPVITALFIVNGKLLGRQPLYYVKVPATFTLPLKPTAGTEELDGFGLTLTTAAANLLNNKALIISEPVLQPGTSAGTADIYTVLSPNNSDE